MIKNRILVGVVVLLILASLVVPAWAKAEKSEFSGTEYLIAFVEPGIVTYPDGNQHVRGMVIQYNDVVDEGDERIGGTNTVVVNYNVKSVPLPGGIAGPMWGTSRVENEGGYWEGTWTGERTEEGFLYAQGESHGGGGYDGLKAKFHIERLSPDPSAPSAFWGYIIDPASE